MKREPRQFMFGSIERSALTINGWVVARPDKDDNYLIPRSLLVEFIQCANALDGVDPEAVTRLLACIRSYSGDSFSVGGFCDRWKQKIYGKTTK